MTSPYQSIRDEIFRAYTQCTSLLIDLPLSLGLEETRIKEAICSKQRHLINLAEEVPMITDSINSYLFWCLLKPFPYTSPIAFVVC